MDVLKCVSDLLPGDLVDLEGDKFADPKRDHIQFQTEYVVVDTVERETPACTAVYFEGFDCVGFPADYRVKVSHRPTYYECGICGHMHPRSWNGDCRDDANRFTCEALDAKHGILEWIEVAMPTINGPQWTNSDDAAHDRPTNPTKV